MTNVRKILIALFLVAVIYVVWLYVFSESYDAKQSRLNSIARSLPRFGGEVLTNKRVGDGSCTGSSDSSLPAINHMVKATEKEYPSIEDTFYEETQRQGIVWDKKAQRSRIFEREGKKYQLELTRYRSPAGHYGVGLSACN